MQKNKYGLSGFIILLTILFASCKKAEQDMVTNPAPPPNPGPVTNIADLVKDTTLMVTKDAYLWYDQIPSSFNARGFTDPEKIMEGIQPYSNEPGFSSPVDRWSFAMKKADWDNLSSGMSSIGATTASTGDFGLFVFFRAEGDLRVRMVEPNSPAGQAGIHRGWRITSINGNNNITTSNANSIVDNVYYSASTTFSFQKPDGSNVSLTLNAAHYTEQPVYMSTVFHQSGKTIGYLVFNSFLGNESQINGQLQQVFNNFVSQGVTDVIVDLRYNGGGYVSLAEKLANYLVNSSANGGLMMTQLHNSKNSQYNETTNFHKAGTLNMTDLYFIVGPGTASASELLINNLKPYMDVKLVGSKTHGKPVGFYPIPIGDWYIFPVSFRTTNKNGEGNYFNGLAVNASVADGLDKDWGDLSESCLASVVRNITTGAYRGQAQESYVEPMQIKNANTVLEQPLLKITIAEKKQ